MSERPLTNRERTDLVAYLDGELSGEAARAVEARINLDAQVRTEADSLRRTWELLDFLPRPEPSPNFTERTLSRLERVVPPEAAPAPRRASRSRRLLLGAGWVALLLLSASGGYYLYHAFVPREPGEQELVRDLRLIENKRFYDLVEDLDFLRKLDDPDLFGEDAGGS